MIAVSSLDNKTRTQIIALLALPFNVANQVIQKLSLQYARRFGPYTLILQFCEGNTAFLIPFTATDLKNLLKLALCVQKYWKLVVKRDTSKSRNTGRYFEPCDLLSPLISTGHSFLRSSIS